MHESSAPSEFTATRLAIARRVAVAHGQECGDASLVSLVSGSVVEDLCDERSDVDMSVLWPQLPGEADLRAACRRAGGDGWFWSQGQVDDGAMVVAFRVDDVEVQIAYSTIARQDAELDDLLLRHNPDTPNHKLAEGLLKAQPLSGAAQLARWQARLAAFPPQLGRAMIEHGLLANPTPWRAMAQMLHRDAELWCRDIVVDACYRLLLALAGLNHLYFTRFQLKRMRRVIAKLSTAPSDLAARMERVLTAPPAIAFAALHGLEGEVLALVAQHHRDLDMSALHARRAAFMP
jgi:hypothetical protein